MLNLCEDQKQIVPLIISCSPVNTIDYCFRLRSFSDRIKIKTIQKLIDSNFLFFLLFISKLLTVPIVIYTYKKRYCWM
ncbi:hypothetical protein A1OE_976 [Candidatus Endolissoclinum faulkneri L2]|uniref:Uncharacterized protein n=1 Tax=Candidatus Endolissoclinum faulkneri L2 TaxID=1193729 RepID=K7YNN7_9PROT|nr:hypothetical protein A1OE_976 [Candidatus Endolissoclinum faulkneri L2]